VDVVDHHERARAVGACAGRRTEAAPNKVAARGSRPSRIDHPVDPDPADRERKLVKLIQAYGGTDQRRLTPSKGDQLMNEII
jgi:hypothetical protein